MSDFAASVYGTEQPDELLNIAEAGPHNALGVAYALLGLALEQDNDADVWAHVDPALRALLTHIGHDR